MYIKKKSNIGEYANVRRECTGLSQESFQNQLILTSSDRTKVSNIELSFSNFFRSEIDSELLDEKSEVLGVLAADNQGLCVLSQGDIDKNLAQVVSSLAKVAAQIEPNNENVPTIVLESKSK